MEEWKLDFEWLRVRHLVKDRFNKKTLPDLNAILYVIGIQELGYWTKPFTKEEKQDLMHIAVCRLLSEDGYFEFAGTDADGWPHWKPVRKIEAEGIKAQEVLLKEKVVNYFNQLGINEEE